MFRFCTEHDRPQKDVANRLLSAGMNGSIVTCFYLDHVVNVTAGSDTLSLLVQDGDHSRPKKKKKLMKKKTKRRGEDIQIYQTVSMHFLPFLKKTKQINLNSYFLNCYVTVHRATPASSLFESAFSATPGPCNWCDFVSLQKTHILEPNFHKIQKKI